MKYLLKEKIVMSTENWEARMGDISIEDFAKENGFEVVEKLPSEIIEQENIETLKKELKEITIWFQENDWKVNKIVIGEWAETDPRWIEYLSERADKRERQDELKALLGE